MEQAIASFISERSVSPTSRNAEVLAKKILAGHRHLGVYVTKDFKPEFVCSLGEFTVATGIIALLVLAQMRQHFITTGVEANMCGGRWAIQAAFDKDIDARTLLEFAAQGDGYQVVDAALQSYERGFPSSYGVKGMRLACHGLHAMSEFAIEIMVTNTRLLTEEHMCQLRRRVVDGLAFAQRQGIEIPSEPLLLRILDKLCTSSHVMALDM